ncbi:MAG: hypothetical protein CME26_04985 [Gemmatimonadetes bacterium]|nr:hypothetical protein [Gemmatimonadota bacterium]
MLLAAMLGVVILWTPQALAQGSGSTPRDESSGERSEPDRDPQWACCIGAGCYDISELLCSIHGGIWHDGFLCESGICDGDSGFCSAGFILDCVGYCQPISYIGDGYCDDGTWGAYFNCAEFACDGGDCPDSSCNLPSNDGACCTSSGCQVLSYENCVAAGGTYMGEYTQCNASTCSCPPGFIPDCSGYCMPLYLLGDGTCNDGDFASDYPYIDYPGIYSLDLLCGDLACDVGDCSTGSCIGACCLDGYCTETLTYMQCSQQGGIFGGTFTSCEDVTCEDVILPLILTDTTLGLSHSNNGGPLHYGWLSIGRISDSHGDLIVAGVHSAESAGDYLPRIAAYVYENGSSEVSQTIYPEAVTNGEIRDISTDGTRILLAGGPHAAIYHKPGSEWVLEQLIIDSSSNFHSAAIAGDRLFLGDRDNEQITVHDFIGGTWQAVQVVPDPSGSFTYFATTISADSQTLVATDSDRVYAYDSSTLALLLQSPIEGRHDYSWNNPPEYSFNDVDVDGDYFIVGDAGAPGGNGYGHVFKRTGGAWASHQFLVPSSASDSQSKIGYAVAINGDRALVTAPQANDAAIRSGGASMFALSNDPWEELARIYPLRATINMGFGISAALGNHACFGLQKYGLLGGFEDPSMMAVTIPEYLWTGQGNGDVNAPANWFPELPTAGSRASMNLQTRYSAYCTNGSLPFNSLDVGPGNMTFDMLGIDAQLEGDLSIGGIRTLAATIGIANGKLEIDGSVDVGSDHRPGTLNLTGSSMAQVAGSYRQCELGTLSCQIEQRPAAALKLEGPISVRGALKMTSDGSYVRSSTDSFLIIESKQAPPSLSDRFQVAIMPGLDDGTFYKLVYGMDGRGTYTVSIVIEQLPVDGDFSPPDTVGVGGIATDILVTDLGSDLGQPDGYADIALTIDGSPGQLYIFLNDGAGNVALQATYNTGNGPSAITSGDYDHDGNMDIVVANALDDTFQAYLNTTGDPTAMSPQAAVSTVDNPVDIISIDIDNDADTDVVIACAGDGIPDADGNVYGVIDFFESTPAMRQTFTNKQTLDTGKRPNGIKPGDIDPGGDKDEDVIITLGSSGQVGFLGHPGDASDWQVDQLIDVGDQPETIQILPITGSNNQAILIGNLGSDSMSVLESDGAGGLEVVASIDLDATPLGMTSLDFDADGDRDLAMLVRDETAVNTIRIYRNDSPLLGDGSLMLAFDQELDTGDNPSLVSSGDTDGDGNDDLVSISGAGPGLRGDGDSILLRRSEDSVGTCDGDATGDSIVDVIDLLQVIGAWGECSGCVEDFDGNEAVDVMDLLIVIGAWGSCP